MMSIMRHRVSYRPRCGMRTAPDKHAHENPCAMTSQGGHRRVIVDATSAATYDSSGVSTDPRDDEPHPSDRPTEIPEFDLQKFARRDVDRSTDAEVRVTAETDSRLLKLAEKLAIREYDEAQALARDILKTRPDDIIALACVEECSVGLEALHAFSTSALERVPSTAIGGPPIHDLRLDHRAGFILSLVDGMSPVSTILDMCPLPRPEALAVIFGLVEDRIIVLS